MYQINHYIVFLSSIISPAQNNRKYPSIPPLLASSSAWYKSNQNENTQQRKNLKITLKFMQKHSHISHIFPSTLTHYYSTQYFSALNISFSCPPSVSLPEAFFNTRFIILIFLAEWWWCCYCCCCCFPLVFLSFSKVEKLCSETPSVFMHIHIAISNISSEHLSNTYL